MILPARVRCTSEIAEYLNEYASRWVCVAARQKRGVDAKVKVEWKEFDSLWAMTDLDDRAQIIEHF